MENRKIVVKENVKEALTHVGIMQGSTIIVHASLSSMGFLCGGAQLIIEALLEGVGANGTIVMPTQSWKNLDPAYGVHWEEPEEWWDIIRENWPAYDKDITPTNTMGAVAEMFRKWPGTIRSNHPARSMAAWGRNADYIVSNHNLSDIFGETSPLAKLYDLDAYVLLMGVGYDKNTSIHLADVRAEYPGKHMEENSSAILVDGKREWVTYETLSVDGEDFNDIGAAFEKTHEVKKVMLGNTQLHLMKQRELVDFAVSWIENNRKFISNQL